MITTIDKLLDKGNISRKESVYEIYSREVLEFPITAGDFFREENKQVWLGNLWIHSIEEEKMEQKKKSPVYQKVKTEYNYISAQIRRIKEVDPKGYDHIEELWELREKKKELLDCEQKLLCSFQADVDGEIRKEYGVGKRQVFVYKDTVSVGSFIDLERQIPALNKLTLPWMRRTPLLLGNIQKICNAVDKKEAIGIVGGPCLFGEYEVEIIVRHRDGEVFSYDFSSGRHYDHSNRKTTEFADHVEIHHKEIEDISFRNWKKGVTAQEADSLEVLFAFGQILNAKVAVPIPDISYLKYLYTVLKPMGEEFRQRVVLNFRKITRNIADMYLDMIEDLRKRYPKVEVCVLHERDEALCEEFYRKREVFFNKSGLIQHMTAKREKTDAIFDYISMLALPFYIWGTPQVIQIDNLDETDSYRKCKKVHKDAFSLSSILYPERLSADGEHTIFTAPLEYKEYIT